MQGEAARAERPSKSAKRSQLKEHSKAKNDKDLSSETAGAEERKRSQFGNLSRGETPWEGGPKSLAATDESG